MSSPKYPILSTGLITAAVPVPKNSTRLPFCAASLTSPIVTGRSDMTSLSVSSGTLIAPAAWSLASESTESRVTPGRITLSSGGVTSSVAEWDNKHCQKALR